MPQLNPAPWLWTFLAMWTILIVLLLPKILSLQQPTPPKPSSTTRRVVSWLWPWP